MEESKLIGFSKKEINTLSKHNEFLKTDRKLEDTL